MAICPSAELQFFAGFTTLFCERFQGLFIKADGNMFYVCNLLYGAEIEAHAHGEFPVYTWFDNEIMTDVVGKVLEEKGLLGKRIGVNSSAQAFNILEIMDKVNVFFRNGKPLLEEVRMHKTPEEMENLRISARMADQALERVIPHIRPGITEGDIRDMLSAEIIRQDGTDLECIVASGPNSAYPHYEAFDRVIEENDLIVIDFGCAYKGMRSDISRTVFIGEPSEEMKKIYDIVDRAQLASESAAVLGAYIPNVDQAARDVLAAEGYDHLLPNRVGHGIGYMTHEEPYIKNGNCRNLEKGMAFSIEPGIYIPGKFGMRIENIVLINENGETEILNHARRDMVVCK